MIIAQLSDPHITLPHEGAGTDTAVQFQRAIDHLLRLPAPPDVVIITGDCVNGGSVAEYERFRELLRPLTMPVYVIPGNHDDRAHLHTIFGDQGSSPLEGFIQYVVDTWPVRLIALDTNVPGRSEGSLGSERLQWLGERLAEAPERPTLLFMHHPPFRTGLSVFDQIGLVHAEAFGALVARHPQVELIVAGHIHTTMARRFHGSLAMTCPATAHQFFPDLQQPDKLVVIQEPTRCLVHVWKSTTGLLTYTSLIGDHGPAKVLHDGEKWVA
jgi:3',5'-cyclic-AMP phosphodiesterase